MELSATQLFDTRELKQSGTSQVVWNDVERVKRTGNEEASFDS